MFTCLTLQDLRLLALITSICKNALRLFKVSATASTVLSCFFSVHRQDVSFHDSATRDNSVSWLWLLESPAILLRLCRALAANGIDGLLISTHFEVCRATRFVQI